MGIVILSLALMLLALGCLACATLIALSAMRKRPDEQQARLINSLADRILAGDWPSYAGFLMNQPRLMVQSEQRAPLRPPPITPPTDDLSELDADPNEPETKAVM